MYNKEKNKIRKMMVMEEILTELQSEYQLPSVCIFKASNKANAIAKMNAHKARFAGKNWKAKWVDGETEEQIGNS